MSCLLGVVDSRILHEEKISWGINKIGGRMIPPADIKSYSNPSCQLCGRTLLLVVQLYCPLEYSTYHRMMYVFACGNQQCWNKSESWVVYRCQTVDQTCVKAREPQTDTKPKPVAEDWGVADTDDWGTDGADDWGTGADDWGSGAGDRETADFDWGMEETEDMTSGVDDTGREKKDEATCSADVDCKSTESLASSAETDHLRDVTDEMPVHQMNLHDSESDNEFVDSHVIPEDACTVNTDRDRLKTLCEATSSAESSCTIIPYYLNVFDEPANQEEDYSHVTKLLRDYEKKEGYRVHDAEYSTESGKKGQGERYEKTSVYHKDQTFHKFVKRVSLCSQQCIRYEWNGTPLSMRQLPAKDCVARCQHCGGETVFEFQLMPASVNYLKTAETADVAVEFGTVLVFTCKQSCWEDGAGVRTEHVIVQADPDLDLFS